MSDKEGRTRRSARIPACQCFWVGHGVTLPSRESFAARLSVSHPSRRPRLGCPRCRHSLPDLRHEWRSPARGHAPVHPHARSGWHSPCPGRRVGGLPGFQLKERNEWFASGTSGPLRVDLLFTANPCAANPGAPTSTSAPRMVKPKKTPETIRHGHRIHPPTSMLAFRGSRAAVGSPAPTCSPLCLLRATRGSGSGLAKATDPVSTPRQPSAAVRTARDVGSIRLRRGWTFVAAWGGARMSPCQPRRDS